MEEKYKQFLNYDWNNSKEWVNFYRNECYIAAPITAEKIIKARKRFYKDKIDKDFDINYEPPEMSNKTCNHNHSTQKHKSIFIQLICAIEGFLWVAYFMNMLMPQCMVDIVLGGIAIRFVRENFFNLFKAKFYKSGDIFRNDMFQLALYSLVLRTDHTNYINLFPFTSTALYCICEYFVNYLRIFQFMRKYFQKVIDQQVKIFQCRGFSYLLFGAYLLIAIPIRWSSFSIGLIYPLFIYYMYECNYYVKDAVAKVKRFPNRFFKKK